MIRNSKSFAILKNVSRHCISFFSVWIHCEPLRPSSQPPATCTLPTWAFHYPYGNMAGALLPIMLCFHLTHQTVAVPAARAPAQITTRQLIELFFSSQAGGHCKNIPTLEYGFLVQVRHGHTSPLIRALIQPAICYASYVFGGFCIWWWKLQWQRSL